MKMVEGAWWRASSNSTRTSFSLSPRHLEMMVDACGGTVGSVRLILWRGCNGHCRLDVGDDEQVGTQEHKHGHYSYKVAVWLGEN